MTIGTKLKAAREHSGMTQEQLADKCDVDRTHIVNIEHDRSAPSLGLLAKIAKVLKTTSGELLP